MTPIVVRDATLADAESVGALFDAYRVFYEAESAPELAAAFIRARLENGDSTIVVAEDAGRIVGFVQLYPTFTSVAMRRMWILNDLFVAPDARRGGIGRALMQAAEVFARSAGAKSLQLETAHTNVRAQVLYESEGYVCDAVFRVYVKDLDGRSRGPGVTRASHVAFVVNPCCGMRMGARREDRLTRNERRREKHDRPHVLVPTIEHVVLARLSA